MSFSLLEITWDYWASWYSLNLLSYLPPNGEAGRSLFYLGLVEGEWFIHLLFFHIKKGNQ